MDARVLEERAAAHFEGYQTALQDMVNVDCGSYSPAGVGRIADLCVAFFAAHGWEVERRPHVPTDGQPQLGDLVIGTLRGSGGPRVLLLGHMDTVFDDGTAAARPYRVEGERAFGPGVSDMKGGLLAGTFATAVLQDAGYDAFDRITYVCNPDEEIGSPFSGPVIGAIAARARRDVRAGMRAGERRDRLRAEGRDRLRDPDPRARRRTPAWSRAAAAARCSRRRTRRSPISALAGRWPGVTCNVGVLRGGTRPNVVPEDAVLEIDLRSPELATLEEAEREVERICREHTIPDVSVELRHDGWHRPMEKTEGSQRLVDLAVEVAAELGFAIEDVATGGASDGNTTSAAGCPTLDGLGPIGGGAHASDEWLDLASVVPRVALLAGLITRL